MLQPYSPESLSGSSRSRLLLALLALAAGLFLLLFTLSLARTEAGDVREYRQADFLAADVAAPPDAEDSRWSAIELPDLLWRRGVVVTGGWYRLRIRLDRQPEQLYGIYLFRLNMNAAFYLNGAYLGDGGKMSGRLTRNWNRPLYVTAPAALWRGGENELLIHLKTYPGFGMFAPVQIGPDTQLKPVYQQRQFVQNELSQTFTALLGLVGLFFLGLWLLRRHDTAYLWFALSSFCWAGFNTHLFVRDPPMQGGLFLWFAHTALDFWMVFLVGFMHRYLGIARARFEKLLFAAQGAFALVFVYPMATYDTDFVSHAATTHAATFALAIYLMALAWQHWRKAPSSKSLALATVLTLFVLAGLHDWLMENPIPGLLSWETLVSLWSNQFHLLFFMVPVLILFLSWHLIQRFVAALDETERLNRELEQRVADAQDELKRNYEARHALEMNQAAITERERIYRDLHDDVGAKLLGLAISAQRANLPHEADLARSALQDLRDVVSRSEQFATPFCDLLADLRAETEQRVRAAGLGLMWRFPEQESDLHIGADAALNLSRILREAVSNVLRHANASRIEIVMRITPGRFVLEVSDNGAGCPIGSVKPHRGMTGMRTRAAALGGQLNWGEIEPGGCKVTLDIPLRGVPPETRG
jgi:signal transduction histidine kinase